MSPSGPDRLDRWLAQTAGEPALNPDLPIIDPHHHLWDRGGHRYLAEELRRDLDCGHQVVATAFVECLTHYRPEGPVELRPVGEVEFVAKELSVPLSTARGPVNAGAAIIARADLTLGDRVETVLDALEDAAPGRVRGVRYATAWHAGDVIRSHYPTEPNMLARHDIRSAIRALGRRDLTFEVWAYFTQLDEVAQAARACPDTTFVVNHCGGVLGIGPWKDRRDEVFDIWSSGLAKLARQENILVKLGGLGMPVAGFDFHKRPAPPTSQDLALSWRPYIGRCIDYFSPKRCIFESNWPVDRTSGHYSNLWNAFKIISHDLSSSEISDLFSKNASILYNINLH